MPASYFPLRWESTGDQWWYASPIDWAAANGHFDLVRELLHIDPNLIIKLTSLRRIRRLETVWDDDSRYVDAARCRSTVARSLLLECEDASGNSLLRAGYGGWLLYTAASAGDLPFVHELLKRDPLMVFGEGEFGVTDILYAAARSRSAQVFRLLLDFALSPRFLMGIPNGAAGGVRVRESGSRGDTTVFRSEILNRAVHAAARGGSLEILMELLRGCSDVLVYRDATGSTVLHAAAGRGQAEVVEGVIGSFDIIDSKDNQGNTSLHVAAFRGHLPVVRTLVLASPTLIYLTNNAGDTFLHIAVAGFRTPGFRRLDRQMELMRQLISGNIINIEPLINLRNNDGRTVLHMAVIGNAHSELLAQLMSIESLDLNIRDIEGMTPLDLLSRRPRSATSELLMKQLISAGGISNCRDYVTRSAIASHLKMQGIRNSPGTTFNVSDSEIFLYTGIEVSDTSGDRGSGRPSSCSSTGKNDLPLHDTDAQNECTSDRKKRSSFNYAANRLKSLLHWPRKKEKDASKLKSRDKDSMESKKKWSEREDTPTPLRERFTKPTSLQNNKRALAVRTSGSISPTNKRKFAAGLMHGVMQDMPHLAHSSRTPSTPPSRSSTLASPSSVKNKSICSEIETEGPSSASSVNGGGSVENTSHKSISLNSRLMNQYFCFGAHGLSVENSVTGQRSNKFYKRSALSAA